jgi:hypothetical protein
MSGRCGSDLSEATIGNWLCFAEEGGALRPILTGRSVSTAILSD